MLVYLSELENLVTESAGNAETMYDLLDYSTGAADSNVLVAAWAILVELQPVLNASFTE